MRESEKIRRRKRLEYQILKGFVGIVKMADYLEERMMKLGSRYQVQRGSLIVRDIFCHIDQNYFCKI